MRDPREGNRGTRIRIPGLLATLSVNREYAEWGVLLGLRPVVSIGSREYPRASFSPETSGLSPFSSLRPPANSNILAPDTCTEGPLATR